MENKIIAVVDGREIKEQELESLRSSLGQNAAYFTGEDGNKRLIDELVMRELIYSDAIAKELQNDEEYLEVLEGMKKSLLQQYALNKLFSKISVTDEDALQYFEKNKEQYKAQPSARASHILVQTEEEANNIINEIKGGLSFEEAAEQYSSCPSKSSGGDLGQFSRGQMVPEFEEAVFAMNEGDLSAPVKTQFGYHIIKVVEKTNGNDVSFESVQDQIKKQCMMMKQNDIYSEKQKELHAKYEIKVLA